MTTVTQSFHVVETPHADPSQSGSVQEFATRHEALIASAKTLRAHLIELAEPGLNAFELFNKWQRTGKGYRIEPEDADQAPFSDVDYARLYVLRLTDDYSHPMFIEIKTKDCLVTANGVVSPARDWSFWVKAPATYAFGDLTALLEAGTRVIYGEMSGVMLPVDGSQMQLQSLSYRRVDGDEAQEAIGQDKNAAVYYVDNDGSFRKDRPTNPNKR